MNNGKNENEISRFKKNNKLPYNVLLWICIIFFVILSDIILLTPYASPQSLGWFNFSFLQQQIQ